MRQSINVTVLCDRYCLIWDSNPVPVLDHEQQAGRSLNFSKHSICPFSYISSKKIFCVDIKFHFLEKKSQGQNSVNSINWNWPVIISDIWPVSRKISDIWKYNLRVISHWFLTKFWPKLAFHFVFYVLIVKKILCC